MHRYAQLCGLTLTTGIIGSGNSRSESYQMFSSFTWKKFFDNFFSVEDVFKNVRSPYDQRIKCLFSFIVQNN